VDLGVASLQGLFLKFKVIQIVIRLKHCGVKTWTRKKNPGAIFKVLKPWVGSYKSLFGVASLQDFFLKTKVIQIVIRLKHGGRGCQRCNFVLQSTLNCLNLNL
jgi:hypothetical protein